MTEEKQINVEDAPAFTDVLRSIREICKDLSKPVQSRHLKTKRQGGAEISFISWFDRVKYLDHFAPGWTSEIRRIENIAGKLIITVRITIPCMEGDVFREATGQEDETKDSYGDSSSNAESMAFSRATAKFGLGLYLYSKGT
jgi:hypothetical protein